MKKVKETNEQIRERLQYPRLDGEQKDAEYMLKIMLGFEPLDDINEVFKKIEQHNQNAH